jgi:hypothetical protein
MNNNSLDSCVQGTNRPVQLRNKFLRAQSPDRRGISRPSASLCSMGEASRSDQRKRKAEENLHSVWSTPLPDLLGSRCPNPTGRSFLEILHWFAKTVPDEHRARNILDEEINIRLATKPSLQQDFLLITDIKNAIKKHTQCVLAQTRFPGPINNTTEEPSKSISAIKIPNSQKKRKQIPGPISENNKKRTQTPTPPSQNPLSRKPSAPLPPTETPAFLFVPIAPAEKIWKFPGLAIPIESNQADGPLASVKDVVYGEEKAACLGDGYITFRKGKPIIHQGVVVMELLRSFHELEVQYWGLEEFTNYLCQYGARHPLLGTHSAVVFLYQTTYAFKWIELDKIFNRISTLSIDKPLRTYPSREELFWDTSKLGDIEILDEIAQQAAEARYQYLNHPTTRPRSSVRKRCRTAS